jgi:DNA-binding LytR/AlgR family response regulator
MQQYNCIIIEDEPLAAEVLRDYIADVPFLNLKKHYNSAVAALNDLHEINIDLIFLDINLPKLKGIEFIKTLKTPPHIIITSAYQEYALEGYDLNIIDYLLKPIEFSRFLKAVNKLKYQVSEQTYNSPALIPDGKDFIYVYVDKKKVRVQLKDIIYIESHREYVRFMMKEKTITTKAQLGQMEEMLNKNDFLRIHRSYIIARDKIEAYSSTGIELLGKTLPIGRSYKEAVMSVLDEK